MRSVPFFALVALTACAPDYGVGASDGTVAGTDGSDGTDGTELRPEDFNGATLRIVSPTDGQFLPLGEPATFEAELLDANGEPIDFDEVIWTSSLDPDWEVQGLNGELTDLPVGSQTFRATVTCQRSARLDAVGAVLVQHEDAGVYAGNMVLDAEASFDGTPITASCIGAAFLTIDAYGEAATGDSTCILSILSFSQELPHVFEFSLSDDDAEGLASVDLGFFALDFEALGAVEEGTFEASWEGDLAGFADLSGSLDLERVTRDLTGE